MWDLARLRGCASGVVAATGTVEVDAAGTSPLGVLQYLKRSAFTGFDRAFHAAIRHGRVFAAKMYLAVGFGDVPGKRLYLARLPDGPIAG